MGQIALINREPGLQFELEPIVAELAQVSARDWLAHAPEPLGDASLPLLAVGGTANLDYAIAGPMQPTPWLERLPALRTLLRSLNTPLSRCRLMRLPAQTVAPAAADHSYHLFHRRILVAPLVASSAVRFWSQQRDGQRETPLCAGQIWTFDHTQPHRLINASNDVCIHLVVESRREASSQGGAPPQDDALPVEPYQFEVLTPPELVALLDTFCRALAATAMPARTFEQLQQRLQILQHRWEQLFARFGHQPAGELAYQDLILQIEKQVAPQLQQWLPATDLTGWRPLGVISSMLWLSPRPSMVAPTAASAPLASGRAAPAEPSLLSGQIGLRNNHVGPLTPPRFTQPLFIVSAPRSGSTLLFETLVDFPTIWSIGAESHELIEGLPALHPAAHAYRSNRLSAADATPEICRALQNRFAHRLQDRTGIYWRTLPAEQRPAEVRLLEKTPKNALRIPFIKAVFPEARFLFLYREPFANISSMMEGWRAQRFQPGYRLPGWPYQHITWSFLLAPGWETLVERPIVEIAAYQWRVANETILDDLAALAPHEWLFVRYDDLVHQPQATAHRIAAFADLPWDEHVAQAISQTLPVSSKTLSAPAADKWRKQAWHLLSIQPLIAPVTTRIEQLDQL